MTSAPFTLGKALDRAVLGLRAICRAMTGGMPTAFDIAALAKKGGLVEILAAWPISSGAAESGAYDASRTATRRRFARCR